MLNREQRAFDCRLVRIFKTILEGDLVNAVNGSPATITLGQLPNLGLVLASSVRINTYFTGGGATTMTLQIGVAGTIAKMMTALDIFSTTTQAIWLPGTAGVQPRGRYGGVDLIATLTPDAGHNLTALTAGSLDIEIVAACTADLNLNF